MIRAATLLVLCLVAPAASAEDPISARAFEIHYRPLEDAVDVVSAVLSEEGEYTLRPRVKTLVVQDRESVLGRVERLLESWDVPPRNAEFTFTLILGQEPAEDRDGRGLPAEPPLSAEVRRVMDMLVDVTKWSDYHSLGSRAVTGAEGDRVVANLGRDYRVIFVLESVHETQAKIKLERLTLQRMHVEEDGRERFEDLYRAGMVLNAGRVTLVGAAKDPSARNALFLAVQGNVR